MSIENTYVLGSTALVIGLSGAVQVLPQPAQRGWILNVTSGGSSGIAFMNAAGQVTCSQGMLLPTTVPVTITGPASFFLAAQGSTAIVGLSILGSQGYSLTGKF